MGTLLDTSVVVALERGLSRLPAERALAEASQRLARTLGLYEDVAMAAITASELLHGVHRASEAHRLRREAFVEAAIEAFPPVEFDLRCARMHARLSTVLVRTGTDIGPHDRLIAATALAGGWRVATVNQRHFAGIPGLDVVVPDVLPAPR